MTLDQDTLDRITAAAITGVLEEPEEHVAASKRERSKRELSRPDAGGAPAANLGPDIVPIVAAVISDVWQWVVSNRDNIIANLSTNTIVAVIMNRITTSASKLTEEEKHAVAEIIAPLIAKQLEERGVIPPRP